MPYHKINKQLQCMILKAIDKDFLLKISKENPMSKITFKICIFSKLVCYLECPWIESPHFSDYKLLHNTFFISLEFFLQLITYFLIFSC